jgi:murein DD-endopeptidase MepM/ murein hydrolase activator NlpD
MERKAIYIVALLGISILNSCSTTGPSGLFGKRSPHEQYGQKLKNAGLDKTQLGESWFAASIQSLNKPLKITIPYKEAGYFPAEKIRAVAFSFDVKRGEKISITLQKRQSNRFMIYTDLWEVKANNNKKLIAFADTGNNPFSHEIDDDGSYLLRIQPELLSAGEYTLTITNGPSLAFPIKNGRIGSFWGADRDGGARRHEGVDIFAPRRTPALAAADGTVNRVTTNQLGGKVVFMRPENKNYSLYYAHLDEQLVTEGERVKTGDTIGLVGNTGNAISTSPHLHFGIYTFGGAINPLAFINPLRRDAPTIKASLSTLGTSVRNTSTTPIKDGLTATSNIMMNLAPNTILEVNSATSTSYRVVLPDGRQGFVSGASVNPVGKALRQMEISQAKYLYDGPDSTAARKSQLKTGTQVNILGGFEDFYFVESGEDSGWVRKN